MLEFAMIFRKAMHCAFWLTCLVAPDFQSSCFGCSYNALLFLVNSINVRLPIIPGTRIDSFGPCERKSASTNDQKAQTGVPATNQHQRQHLSDFVKIIEWEADLRCKTRGLGTLLSRPCVIVPYLRPSGVASYDILMILYVNIQRYFSLQNSVPESV